SACPPPCISTATVTDESAIVTSASSGSATPAAALLGMQPSLPSAAWQPATTSSSAPSPPPSTVIATKSSTHADGHTFSRVLEAHRTDKNKSRRRRSNRRPGPSGQAGCEVSRARQRAHEVRHAVEHPCVGEHLRMPETRRLEVLHPRVLGGQLAADAHGDPPVVLIMNQ